MEANNTGNRQVEVNCKAPKLPQFIDGTDMIDSYEQRFQCFARKNNWTQDRWAS